MMLKSLRLITPLLVLAVAATSADAQDLDLTDWNNSGTLTVTHDGSTQTVYASPYQGHFVYGGGITSPTYDFFCIDFGHYADLSQNPVQLTSMGDAAAVLGSTRFGQAYGEASLVKYQQAGWLISQYYNGHADTDWTAIQLAIWKVFTPTASAADPYGEGEGLEYAANQWLLDAQDAVPTYENGAYSNFVIVTGDLTAANGGPQEFVMVTPEPETYALFATGLLFLGIAYRRRRKNPELGSDLPSGFLGA